MDLLLRLLVEEIENEALRGRNPCCSGPTASTGMKLMAAHARLQGRNPCCSGPTASTVRNTLRPGISPGVAIPVVVDLLLRPYLEFTLGLLIFSSQSLL